MVLENYTEDTQRIQRTEKLKYHVHGLKLNKSSTETPSRIYQTEIITAKKILYYY